MLTRRAALALPLIALAGGALAQAGFTPPPVGARWTYRRNAGPEEGSRLRDRTHAGRPALAYARTDEGGRHVDLFDTATGDWFVSLDGQGRPVAGASPQNFALNWPLSPGKRWTAAFDLRDYGAARATPTRIDWTVEGEEVWPRPVGPVPAIRLRGVSADGIERLNWFAPTLGVYLRQLTRDRGLVVFDREIESFRR